MKPLFQLVEQFRSLEQLSEEDFDEQTLRDTLEGLQGEIEIKATNVCAHVLNLDAYAVAAKEASKALAARAARIQRRADTIREYVRLQLAASGIKKIDGPEFTIARKLNPPAVVIAPGTEVPEKYLQPQDPMVDLIVKGAMEASHDEEYVTLKPSDLADIIARHLPPRQPDKKAIAAALKAKQEIPGCSLDQGERLEIRV